MKEMKKVLYNKELADKFPELELYYVWRGVDKKDGLRYDITLIPPQMLCEEYVRTKGNRNSENYFELYTVLEGKAIFLMQKFKKEIVEDVMVIKAKKEDWISISSEYAVIIINPSNKILKTGNWVSEKNENTYQELEEMGGGCYFYTKSGWIKNKNYKHIPKIHFEKPLNPIRKNKILKAIKFLKFSNGVKKMPKSLDFLKG